MAEIHASQTSKETFTTKKNPIFKIAFYFGPGLLDNFFLFFSLFVCLFVFVFFFAGIISKEKVDTEK